VATDSAAQYASGYLLFRSGSALMATKLRSGIRQAVRISSPSHRQHPLRLRCMASIFSVSQTVSSSTKPATRRLRACALPVRSVRQGTQRRQRSGKYDDRSAALTDGKRLPTAGPLGIWILDLIRQNQNADYVRPGNGSPQPFLVARMVPPLVFAAARGPAPPTSKFVPKPPTAAELRRLSLSLRAPAYLYQA